MRVPGRGQCPSALPSQALSHPAGAAVALVTLGAACAGLCGPGLLPCAVVAAVPSPSAKWILTSSKGFSAGRTVGQHRTSPGRGISARWTRGSAEPRQQGVATELLEYKEGRHCGPGDQRQLVSRLRWSRGQRPPCPATAGAGDGAGPAPRKAPVCSVSIIKVSAPRRGGSPWLGGDRPGPTWDLHCLAYT